MSSSQEYPGDQVCSHFSSSTEDFSYFTLVLNARPSPSPKSDERAEAHPVRSLFGISCTRQLDASTLKNRPADVTRSAVQKAVVVVGEDPLSLCAIREKLSVVTKAWFAQR